MKYTVTAPMSIGPRLMPAVIIGQDTDTYGTVHIEIDHYDGQRYVARYVIDTSGETYEAADVRTGVCQPTDDPAALSGTLRSLTGALLAFLGNEAERYRWCMGSGDAQPPEGWAFSAGIAEWAYLNSDEISMVQLEIEGDEY